MTKSTARTLVTALMSVVVVLFFASSAFATNFLGHDGVITAVGEGNPLGGVHTETSPAPNGDQAYWYNHPFSFYDFYLYDDSAPETRVVPDELTSQRTYPTLGEREGFDATLTVDEEGLYSISATAVVGAADSVVYAAGIYAGLDQTRPTVSSDALPVYDGTGSVTIFASDALSGVEFIAYQLDNAPVDELIPAAPLFTTTTRRLSIVGSPVVTAGPGVHTLSFWSLDNAGNLSARHTVSFRVNAPGYVPVLSAPTVKTRASHMVTFKGNVTPAATLKTVKLTIQRKRKGVFKPYVSFSFPIAPYAGSYSYTGALPHGTYRVRASEGAGVSGWRVFNGL